MASRRQSESSLPLIVAPDTCESPVQLSISRQNSMALVEDVAALRPGNAQQTQRLRREAERQTHFQKVSNDILAIPNGYRKVEVLIIRWDDSVDDFKGHTEEIEKLRKIFTDDFRFNCRVEKLRNCRPPQLDLNHAILSQVREHHEEDTLNIIYYTGHGVRVEDTAGARLELAATQSWIERRGLFNPSAYWDEAEQPLLTYVLGDVLVILDCCYASTAAVKGKNDDFRAYQLLAATPPEGATCEPGDKSFTHVLCNSLKGLLQEANGGTFRVDQLCQRINTQRTTQASMHWNRLPTYNRSIELGRLDRTHERELSFKTKDFEKASLLLRFSLKKADLTNYQIAELARKLPKICGEANVPVRRIDWVEMKEQQRGKRLQDLINTVMIKQRSLPESAPKESNTFSSKKRASVDSLLFAAPKRPALDTLSIAANRTANRPPTPESGMEN